MVQIALERARYSHCLGEAFEQLSTLTAALERGGSGGGLSGAAVAGLQDRVLALQLALGRMANVKEFRTPQVSQAGARLGLLLWRHATLPPPLPLARTWAGHRLVPPAATRAGRACHGSVLCRPLHSHLFRTLLGLVRSKRMGGVC